MRKQRTFMQPQMNKAEKKDYTAKDYLFSTLKLKSSEIKMLNEKGQLITVDAHTKSLLPNSHHPYDHYIVKV